MQRLPSGVHMAWLMDKFLTIQYQTECCAILCSQMARLEGVPSLRMCGPFCGTQWQEIPSSGEFCLVLISTCVGRVTWQQVQKADAHKVRSSRTRITAFEKQPSTVTAAAKAVSPCSSCRSRTWWSGWRQVHPSMQLEAAAVG